jgi:hypothetical protein
VPYALLGLLTLGAGVGVALGLSNGPVTYDASAAVLEWYPCTASTRADGAVVSCHSKPTAASSGTPGEGPSVGLFFSRGARLPENFTTCVTTSLNGASIPTSHQATSKTLFRYSSTVGQAVTAAVKNCNAPAGHYYQSVGYGTRL